MRIRLRELADLEQCVEVLSAVHRHDGYPLQWPEDPISWLSPPGLVLAWVVDIHAHPMGHIAVLAPAPSRRQRGDKAEISRLFVSPLLRGKGVGAQLLDVATLHARSHGWSPWLEVVEGDGRAARFYERLGWRLVDRRSAPWATSTGSRPILREYYRPRDVVPSTNRESDGP